MNQETETSLAPGGDTRARVTGSPWAIAHAVIGDTWTQLILREAFFGVRRFTDWSRNLGIPRSVLTDRLQRLCEAGVLEKRVPSNAKRAEYRLTAKGQDLCGAAILQSIWERDHASSAMQRRYALSFYDARTNQPIRPGVLDAPHGRTIDARDMTIVEGPGLAARAPPDKRRLSSSRMSPGRPMIERSVNIIGDYWSWAVIGSLFLGIRRFDDIATATGMAPNILSDRLTRLSHEKVLARVRSANDRYHEYRLTQAGLDLYPLIVAIYGWFERWLCEFDRPPLQLVRRATGEPISPVVCDLLTGKPINWRYVRWRLEAPSGVRSRPSQSAA
jgi:DNA-binding HxlR family transcriptional regulator